MGPKWDQNGGKRELKRGTKMKPKWAKKTNRDKKRGIKGPNYELEIY